MRTPPTTDLVRRFVEAFQASDPELRDRLFAAPSDWHEPGSEALGADGEPRRAHMRVFGRLRSSGTGRCKVEVLDVLGEDDLAIQWYDVRTGTHHAPARVERMTGCRVRDGRFGAAWASDRTPRTRKPDQRARATAP